MLVYILDRADWEKFYVGDKVRVWREAVSYYKCITLSPIEVVEDNGDSLIVIKRY